MATRYINAAPTAAQAQADLPIVPNAAGITFDADTQSLIIRAPDTGTIYTLPLASAIAAVAAIAALPTANPGADLIWNDGGVLKNGTA